MPIHVSFDILRARRATPADRDNTGKFLPGNRYRFTEETRSIRGTAYTRRVNGVSGRTVQYLRATAEGNSR